MRHNNQQDVIDILSENSNGLPEEVLSDEMKRRNTARVFNHKKVLKPMLERGEIHETNGLFTCDLAFERTKARRYRRCLKRVK